MHSQSPSEAGMLPTTRCGRVFFLCFFGFSNELNFPPLFSEVKAAYGQRRIGKGNEACFDSATDQLVREYTLEWRVQLKRTADEACIRKATKQTEDRRKEGSKERTQASKEGRKESKQGRKEWRKQEYEEERKKTKTKTQKDLVLMEEILQLLWEISISHYLTYILQFPFTWLVLLRRALVDIMKILGCVIRCVVRWTKKPGGWM